MQRWIELAIVLVLAASTEILFWDGQLDLTIAEYFYHDDAWSEQHFWLWRMLYTLGEPINWWLAGLALFYYLGSRWRPQKLPAGKSALYIFLLIVLGPALLVNGIVKDNWGRPRPRETQTFGGAYPYQPPLQISGNGRKSFVCGHCASAFVLFGGYFLARRRRLLLLSLACIYGLLMGWARMSAGAHFLSDILWSGYLMFLLSWLLYYRLWPTLPIKPGIKNS
ncbi:MAG: phosphatase PAP2 family protein [Methylococcales bacterium]|nr:phosphatase PAP2 family protein [Methylococcales bacterium]